MKHIARSLRIAAVALLALGAISACTHSGKDDVHLERDFTIIDTTGFGEVFNEVYGRPCNELHSLLVVRDGKIVYEKYGPGHTADELHVLWSASKTFTATAVGFAVQDGLLSVDDKVVSFFDPEELPAEPSEWLQGMTLKNLLTMSSGFAYDGVGKLYELRDENWAKDQLSAEILWEPGTRFSYNSMNTYLLSVIVSKVTGMKMSDYLDSKLFRPLGISRYISRESPQGYDCGGWGFYMTSESLAKMGQFFLNKGAWNGKQLLDPAWIEEAASAHVMQYQGVVDDPDDIERMMQGDGTCGYGYQMWRCTHNGVRLDGAWGQYVIILPEKEAAVVMTSHVNGVNLLNLVWKYIYPSL